MTFCGRSFENLSASSKSEHPQHACTWCSWAPQVAPSSQSANFCHSVPVQSKAAAAPAPTAVAPAIAPVPVALSPLHPAPAVPLPSPSPAPEVAESKAPPPAASNAEVADDPICIICQGSMAPGTGDVKTLECGHTHHVQCMEAWFAATNSYTVSCPLRCQFPSQAPQNSPNLATAAADDDDIISFS